MVEAPPKEAPRLFLIDAYALIYRAFFAFINRPLTNSRGENTSAPFGFANFLLSIRENHQPDYLAIVFDKGMSKREEIYPEYKATREKMPEELAASLPRIREMVEGFHDPVVEVEGYEADDVIGTLALQAREAGLEAVIVSGDKDLYQLVGPGIHLLNPGRGGPTGVEPEWVDESNADEKFGIPPGEIPDYLALIGDSSDNVPGAPGIGPKTAVKLLQEYRDLEEILAHAQEISGKASPGVSDGERRPGSTVEAAGHHPDRCPHRAGSGEPPGAGTRPGEAQEALRGAGVPSSGRAVHRTWRGSRGWGGRSASPEEIPVTYILVGDVQEVAELVERIREAGSVSVDTETTSQDATRADLVGISLSWRAGEAYYLPLGHHRSGELALDDGGAGAPANLPALSSPAMGPLVEMLEDPAVEKTGQNLKYDLIVLERAGVKVRGVAFDTMVASYVLDPNRRQHSLDALTVTLLGHRMISYSEVAGKGKSQISFAEVTLDRAREYACEDADFTLRLRELFEPQLREQKLDGLFREAGDAAGPGFGSNGDERDQDRCPLLPSHE